MSASAGAGGAVVVVGAAILDGDRVLAAQRAAPPRLAGYWEFPGGKVEPGESDRDALRRECREELGVDVEVGRRLGADVPLGDSGAVLRVFTARLRRGTPAALEHTALRWVGADEAARLGWLPTNAPLLPALDRLLRSRTG